MDQRLDLILAEIEKEKENCENMRLENEGLKRLLFDLTTVTEQAEEKTANTLLKKISVLQQEKKDMLFKIREDEKFIRNELEVILVKKQLEKFQLETTLEQEQESIVNKLQKQLDELKIKAEHSFEYEGKRRSTDLKRKSSASSSTDLMTTSVVELLRAEINSLKEKFKDQQKIVDNWKQFACANYSALYNILKSHTVSLETIPNNIPPPNLTVSTNTYDSAESPSRLSSTSSVSISSSKRLQARIPLPN